MGNSCSKSSATNFAGEGRTLGATPVTAPTLQQTPRSQLPSKVHQEERPPRSADRGDGTSAAGRAAQERMDRAAAAAAQGRLGKQLAEQKKLTHTDTMKAYSDEQQQLRVAQSNAEARNWN